MNQYKDPSGIKTVFVSNTANSESGSVQVANQQKFCFILQIQCNSIQGFYPEQWYFKKVPNRYMLTMGLSNLIYKWLCSDWLKKISSLSQIIRSHLYKKLQDWYQKCCQLWNWRRTYQEEKTFGRMWDILWEVIFSAHFLTRLRWPFISNKEGKGDWIFFAVLGRMSKQGGVRSSRILFCFHIHLAWASWQPQGLWVILKGHLVGQLGLVPTKNNND